jgi:hypothetical protein
MVFKDIGDSLPGSVATWAFSGRARPGTQDYPVYIPRAVRCPVRLWPPSKAIAFDGWHLGALVPVVVTARTVQGMARVRSGQAAAWPLVSGRSVRRGSKVKRSVYVHLALFTCARRPAVTVTLEAGGADTDTQRAIPGSEPSQGSCTFGVSPCRSTSLGDQCPRAAGLSPGVW